jgi:thiol-disulfide isomerase/thioredoxin
MALPMNRGLVLLAVTLGAVPSCTRSSQTGSEPGGAPKPTELAMEGVMPPLVGATEWLNSAPLTAGGLRGKVVLVDFWTYTCINWRRSLPYVRAWADRYRAQGLVVVGVHTPEFEFEHEIANVRAALQDMDVEYPVAVDDSRAIWNAFHNEYWPAIYLIDAAGRIRHHQFGEGEYEESERAIQELLRETGAVVGSDLVAPTASGAEAAADWGDLQSGETYLGYDRAANFSSRGGAQREEGGGYVVPPRLARNQWGLGGAWTVKSDRASSNQAHARIAYEFHARDLHLVMGPSVAGTSARFRVRIDGQAPGDAHGVDVDATGMGTLQGPRMYQLIRQPGVIVDRLFEIEFDEPGAEVFSFTFG